MKITILGKSYKVSDRLREVIEQKVEKFDKYFNDDVKIKVVCKEERNKKFTMELTFKFAGRMIRSEVTSDNMYSNIDLALPKIEGQIRKYKTKLQKKLKQDAYEQAHLYDNFKVVKEAQIVKNKSLNLLSISVNDAIVEMDMIDNDFYLFVNDKTGKVNVVYKRKNDDNYGLIELEY